VTRVRLATIADAQRIAELMGELGYHAPAPVIESNLAVIATSPVDRVLVALVDDVIAGVVSLHVMDLFHIAGRIGRITSLVVDTNHRGAGVGRQLVVLPMPTSWQADAYGQKLQVARIALMLTLSTKRRAMRRTNSAS